METKTIARIGAIAFVAIAITMTALQLRDEPAPAPSDEMVSVAEPEFDPLPAMLRSCASLGEAAAQERACLDAWAENRRRFLSLGIDPKNLPTVPALRMPTPEAGGNVPPSPKGTH